MADAFLYLPHAFGLCGNFVNDKETFLEFVNATKPDGIVEFILNHRISEIYVGVKPSALDI